MESWRHTLKRRGMKEANKAEYFCVNENEADGREKMLRVETVKVDKFKSL